MGTMNSTWRPVPDALVIVSLPRALPHAHQTVVHARTAGCGDSTATLRGGFRARRYLAEFLAIGTYQSCEVGYYLPKNPGVRSSLLAANNPH